MVDFCEGEAIWDTGLTWTNNSWPQFTECFQNIVLQTTPCAFLWLITPFCTYSLARKTSTPRPIKPLFVMKLIGTVVLFCLFILELAQAIAGSSHFNDEYLAPVLWMATLLLHTALIYLEKSCNTVKSPGLFVFWILAGICNVVPVYSSIQLKTYNSDPSAFTLILIKFIAITFMFVLNCFSTFYGEKPKGHNPELSASMSSWISFSWIDRLLLKGFKSPLVDGDVFDLNPRDKSTKEVNKLLHQWQQLKTRSNRKRVRRRQSGKPVSDNEKTPLLSSSTSLYGVDKQENEGNATSSATHSRTETPVDGQETSKVSFFTALFRCYWFEAVEAQIGMVVVAVMNILNPFILGFLIDFTANLGEFTWHGYIYATALLASKVVTAVFDFPLQFLTNCVAIRVRSAAIATVFRKALTMCSEARKDSTVGEIVNLMSVDAANLEMMMNYSFWLWLSVIYMVVGAYFLYTVVGVAMFAGLGYIFVMFILNAVVMEKMRQYQDQIMIVKDERVKLMSEVLNGMKVIKLYGWEPMFKEKILEVREKELKILFKYAVMDGFQSFAWTASSFWMMHLMLVTYVMTDDSHYLDANTSILTMNYIELIRLGINLLPIIVKDWIKAATSLMRMNKFLNGEDLNPKNLIRDTTDKLAVRFSDADFKWEKAGLPTLRSINMEVEPGQLVAVVGTVGAGKSSLLSAMLGEMHRIRGYSNINSSVAYVPQSAWIQNNTLRGNILFGKRFDSSFYRSVVKACALQPDLDIMAAGDQTEIGEKGINLSGGQKQRVSLARAVYSGADIYLMDDPLSAVDSHVGRHIFDHVISNSGVLRGKTRILVTHGIHWLPDVDYIYVMNQGRISEAGTYEELISHNGAFAQFLAQYLTQNLDNDGNESTVDEEDDKEKEIKADILRRLTSIASDSEAPDDEQKATLMRLISHDPDHSQHDMSASYTSARKRKASTRSGHWMESSQRERSMKDTMTPDKSRLTTEEAADGGKVKWSVYGQLLKGFGIPHSVAILFMIVCYHVANNYANIWLTNWTDDSHLGNFTELPANGTVREDKNINYLGVFTALGFIQTFFVIAYSVVLQIRHVHASRKLHFELLDSVMHAPMSFFDTTPMGRLLNRFSQDVERLDNDICVEIEIVLDFAMQCLGIFVIISYTIPIMLAFIVPISILLYLLQQFYIRTSCQLRRIESNNRSPVYAHFSETLSGVSVIRAYQAQDRFIADSEAKIDGFQKAVSAFNAVNKWIQCRLEVLGFLILLAACVFAVQARDSLSPGLVGLAITYAMRVSVKFIFGTRIFGDLETHIVSVERMREYSELQSEAPWTAETDATRVTEEWPATGRVEFVDYSTRYREGLDLVLKNLTCSINGGEKVGIVGRTGAGKSSMVLSLFRLIESVSGKIIIDGVDIGKLGLHTLRRHITILPQDPVLFAGSLRMNLDPFNESTDAGLWTALEHSHLKKFVESLPQQLDHEVGEGGENLSMGQRQLICLARTLLRKTKILILDEATAAVDIETDELIQKTIREEFSGCTILTIAHRLNTVMDYDRILVLEKGSRLEFDSPNNLLSNHQSAFYSMAKQAGLV
ncbi:multidrug resistance-associated protein 1 [Aplysia californica]|uniref:ABC-type glutathione-S-conjugate transporter n=1 Tax=Aplysia californica TaxID=6500 RepID=A0ABM1VVR1_APLCA|nr:multidrug resistance-associated protein 1 [Aplysia californica]